ncbi:alpha/beta hydrolase [Lactobacillus sp. ESL0791]|uniref:alpha/beta hydrolase n=1 Tax=Lactobacillus sp. ESL0791 TaxID=2983234 RepID=UPI0023F9B106|nr:alpha/beta hydrolase [Lactobacillus sp. ESL0791]MDF7637866.1 alpha/beta hydrolase [Lactobacillus sp. ESL0791]
MEQKYQETTIGKIEYTMRKGTPLVVFLNSFGSFDTAQSFSTVIRKLPADYGVFAPDYLNTGFSGKSLKPYTLTDEAIEIAKIINSFNAERVIIVAHSLGGVYAFQMRNKVKNLSALVEIEPTTREIILNPPQEKSYLEKKNAAVSEEFIHNKINTLFPETEATEFWQTTDENSAKFDEAASQNAMAAMENDEFWQGNDKSNADLPVIIFTETYRKDEYRRSEYFNDNPQSKIIPLGSFHYLHWEYPKEVANAIIDLSK